MNSIEVCLSPDLIHQFELKKKITVIVDVLRATSCFTAGIASGVAEIIPVAEVETCRKLRAEGYLLAGERGGQLIEGFDMGNSPFDYMHSSSKGKKVAATTTNGTKAIHLSKDSEEIIIGSFLNLKAIADYLIERKRDVVIFCAGWKGKVNLEDSLFAGALVRELDRNGFQAMDDSGLICRSSFVTVRDQLPEIIARSEHARRLSGYNMARDVAYCSQMNVFDVVPKVIDGKIHPS